METIRIKPVNKDFFDSSKVSLREIAVKRRAGVAVLADRYNPDGSVTRVFLIPEPAKALRDTKFYEAVHMETGRAYGRHQVVASVEFKFKDGVLQLKGEFPMEVGTMTYSDIMEETAVAFQMVG